jgi:hypothetical protein
MTLYELIKSQHWLSIEHTILDLYPDQNEIIEEYRRVFESLLIMQPVNEEMLIVLAEIKCDSSDESQTEATYIDVSGRKQRLDLNSLNDNYAMEFVNWENWIGMKLAPETLENFSELEIIAHCLYEMTFCGFNQDEIQEQYASINNRIEDFKILTEEEKKQTTISYEDFKKRFESYNDD